MKQETKHPRTRLKLMGLWETLDFKYPEYYVLMRSLLI